MVVSYWIHQIPHNPFRYVWHSRRYFSTLVIPIGFWEQFAMTYVTRALIYVHGQYGWIYYPDWKDWRREKGTKGINEDPGGIYHVHWYKYPLLASLISLYNQYWRCPPSRERCI
ncbi:MAG: hypothetical protein ACL7BU_06375 [Candidatus Phlomobacter fragariae]